MKKFTIKNVLDGFRSSVAQPARPDQEIQETLRPEHFQVKRVSPSAEKIHPTPEKNTPESIRNHGACLFPKTVSITVHHCDIAAVPNRYLYAQTHHCHQTPPTPQLEIMFPLHSISFHSISLPPLWKTKNKDNKQCYLLGMVIFILLLTPF